LLYPVGNMDVGAPRDLVVTQADQTGASYYPKAGEATAFGSGKIHNIKPGEGNVAKLVAEAEDGDTIRLLAGTHIVDRVITIPHTLKFEGVGNPTLLYERDALFQIQEGGSLRIEGHSNFEKIGHNKRNKRGGSFRLHGAQVTLLEGNRFKEARPVIIDHTVGEPKTRIIENDFGGSAAPRILELNSDEENTAMLEGNKGMSK